MTPDDRTAMLIPIHPHYADRIFDGTKTIEIRKTPIRTEVIYLYVTAPISRIAGAAWIYKTDTTTPRAMTPAQYTAAHITRRHLADYATFDQEITLHHIGTQVRFPRTVQWWKPAPQGPRYLTKTDTDRILTEGGMP